MTKVNTKELSKAIGFAMTAAPRMRHEKDFNGVALSREGDKLFIASRGFETAVCTHIFAAGFGDDWKAYVNGQTLRDWLNVCAAESVELAIDGKNKLSVAASKKNRSTLLQLDEPDYKGLFMIRDATKQLAFMPEECEEFLRALKFISGYASTNEASIILTCVHIEAHEGFVKLVATDSFSLAYAPIKAKFDKALVSNIPARSMGIVLAAANLADECDVAAYTGDAGEVYWEVGRSIIRLVHVDQKYPMFEKVLEPGGYEINLKAGDLLEGARASNVFGEHSILELLDGERLGIISIASGDSIGTAATEVPIRTTEHQQGARAKFNNDFLIKAMKDCAEVKLWMRDGRKSPKAMIAYRSDGITIAVSPAQLNKAEKDALTTYATQTSTN